MSKIELEKQKLATMIEMQEETQNKISREIHDNVNQLLTLSKLNLNAITHLLDQSNQETIRITQDLLTTAIHDLSNISRTLSGEIIKDVGLVKSLEFETERLNTLNHVEMNLSINIPDSRLSFEISLILFRLFQEAIRNSIIHGKSKKIFTVLEKNTNGIRFSIKDDGIGFNIDNIIKSNNHQGIENMKRRVHSIKGNFQINSFPHNGTEIIIDIPIENC